MPSPSPDLECPDDASEPSAASIIDLVAAPNPAPDVEAPPMPARRLAYRLLTGPDDAAFCARVSAALADGYRLYGSPAATFDGERVIVAQAVVRLGTADEPGVGPDGALA